MRQTHKLLIRQRGRNHVLDFYVIRALAFAVARDRFGGLRIFVGPLVLSLTRVPMLALVLALALGCQACSTVTGPRMLERYRLDASGQYVSDPAGPWAYNGRELVWVAE